MMLFNQFVQEKNIVTFVNERSFIMKPNQKEHIMDTALRLFAEKGYGNTSIASIARAAGVAQGLMYNYFESKEALLLGIMQKGFAGVEESMSVYEGKHSPKKALELHVEATIAQVSANKSFWKLFHSIKMQDQVQQFLEAEYAQAKLFIIKTLSANFKKLGYDKPADEAKLFFVMIDGLVVHHLMDAKTFPLHTIKKTIFQRYHL